MTNYTSYNPPTNRASCLVSKQVVNLTAQQQTGSTTANTWNDISDGTTTMSLTLTPTASTNNLLIQANINLSPTVKSFLRFVQDGNALLVGGSAGSRTQALTVIPALGANASIFCCSLPLMIQAGTTSSTTIKLQWNPSATGTLCVNRAQTDTNASTSIRCISQMTIFEFSN